MPDVNNQLIALLRGFVQETAPELPAAMDIASLWRAAAQQNLLPVLAYENRRHRLFSDEALCRQLDGLLHAAVGAAVQRCAAFEALSQTLSDSGIAHMPVKGYYLRALYPVPEVRTFGDIDVLIHPEDRQKAHQLLLSLGYQSENNWEPTYSYRKGAEYYELHTNLMDGNLDGRSDLQAYFAAAWAHAEPDEGLRFRPAADFHLIYTVCHLAKHLYGGGAGLRMYLDVALYVRHFDSVLEWDKIADEFSTLHLWDFFCTVMNACRVWFGVESGCPLPQSDGEALAELLDYTLDADLFGHLRDHGVVRLRNGGEEATRSRVLLRMLFPPAKEIEQRYTFLQRRPWLLPAAWVVRMFANLERLPAQLHNMNRVSQTESGTVDAYNSFMKRLGL